MKVEVTSLQAPCVKLLKITMALTLIAMPLGVEFNQIGHLDLHARIMHNAT